MHIVWTLRIFFGGWTHYRLDLHVHVTSNNNINLAFKCWTEIDIEVRSFSVVKKSGHSLLYRCPELFFDGSTRFRLNLHIHVLGSLLLWLRRQQVLFQNLCFGEWNRKKWGCCSETLFNCCFCHISASVIVLMLHLPYSFFLYIY